MLCCVAVQQRSELCSSGLIITLYSVRYVGNTQETSRIGVIITLHRRGEFHVGSASTTAPRCQAQNMNVERGPIRVCTASKAHLIEITVYQVVYT